MDVNNSLASTAVTNPATTSTQSVNASNSDSDSSASEAIEQAKAAWSNERYVDRLPRSYADQVSLSYKSQQLSDISAEFFTGTITSDQIPALTQRLYEGGLINAAEYQSLGGVEQKISAVSEAQSFLNQQLMSVVVQSDAELQTGFANVVQVLRNMDSSATPQQREAEQQALSFISEYREQQQLAGADSSILDGLDQVMDVLTALEKVRNNEQATGALASYNSVQEAYDEANQ